MEELLIGKMEDTNDARMNLAEAYVAQEQEISDLRVQMGDEEDAAKRAVLRARIRQLTEDLNANKAVEAAVAAEISMIHENNLKAGLQKAKEAFQNRILLIGQEFEKKFTALQNELQAELEARAKIVAIQKEAIELAQNFALQGEKLTIEGVNRQIAAYNRLAEAVKNAARGVQTSPLSLSMTAQAQAAVSSGLKIPEVKAQA